MMILPHLKYFMDVFWLRINSNSLAWVIDILTADLSPLNVTLARLDFFWFSKDTIQFLVLCFSTYFPSNSYRFLTTLYLAYRLIFQISVSFQKAFPDLLSQMLTNGGPWATITHACLGTALKLRMV